MWYKKEVGINQKERYMRVSGGSDSDRKKKLIIGSACLGMALALAVAILFFSGYWKKEEKVAPEKVVNIRVATVDKKPLRPYVEAVGTLKAYEEIIVSSEIDGILKRINVVEGTRVARGALIAEINPTDYILAVKQAEAAIRQAQATVANAKQEYQRKEALYKEQLVTQQQFDDVAARREVAEGDIDRAKFALDLAKEKLTKTKIYAHLAGGVKEKRVTAGDYVRNGSPLIVLIQTNPLKLGFTISEKDVGKLKVGQDVAFKVDAFPDKSYTGTLKNIYANMEEKTRSLQVEAIVSNPQDVLKPGLFTRVILYTGAPRDTVIIPINALLYEATNVNVFIVENDRAVERPVKVGQKYGEFMEILEGLKGGETLVVVGQNNVAKGVKVRVAR